MGHKKRNDIMAFFQQEAKAFERSVKLCKKPKRGDKVKHPPKRPAYISRVDPRIVARASRMGI
jgi:hypothetical protein